MLDIVAWAVGNFIDTYLSKLIELLGPNFKEHPLFKEAMASFEADPTRDTTEVFEILKRKCLGRIAA